MCAVNCSLCELVFRGITYGTIKLVKTLCWMRNIPSCIVFWLRGNWAIDKNIKKGNNSSAWHKRFEFPWEIKHRLFQLNNGIIKYSSRCCFPGLSCWVSWFCIPSASEQLFCCLCEAVPPADLSVQYSCFHMEIKSVFLYLFACELCWGMQRHWGQNLHFGETLIGSGSTLILAIREQWWNRDSKKRPAPNPLIWTFLCSSRFHHFSFN